MVGNSVSYSLKSSQTERPYNSKEMRASMFHAFLKYNSLKN